MNFDRDSLLLYAVTDRAWLKGQTLAQQVEQALLGGATMVQLREKQLDLPHFRREALEIQALCRRYGVPFLINDNVDLALDIGADGVHVGQEDMEAGLVRQKLGPGKILGVSAHSPEEALRAQAAGADYLGAGAVFHTGTKSNVSTLSYDTLRDICAAVKIPVVAIGGISHDNILELKNCGLDGVAVVSALFAQADVKAAAEELLRLSEEIAR
mgnify:CR=1 FL=1